MNSKALLTDKQVQEIQKKFGRKKQEFLRKFDFIHSDINQDQLQDIMYMLLYNENIYLQKKDLGLKKQKLHVNLLPNSAMAKRRLSRVSLHYQEKLLDHSCKKGIKKWDQSPTLILSKRNIVKFIFDIPEINN